MIEGPLMRTAVIAALLAVLAAPVQSQVPEVSAARVALSGAASQSADGARTVKYLAAGAAIGAAMWIGLAAAVYSISYDVCELASEKEGGCERPNYVKIGLLGAAAGALAGAIILTRDGENANGAHVRVSSFASINGLALRIVFR
jgi:hypothetical protein